MDIRVSPSACYFYVLLLSDGGYYTGITNNVSRRMDEHSKGRSKSTRSRLPVVRYHYAQCSTRQIARMYEVAIKNRGAARWLAMNARKLDVVYCVTACVVLFFFLQLTGNTGY